MRKNSERKNISIEVKYKEEEKNVGLCMRLILDLQADQNIEYN